VRWLIQEQIRGDAALAYQAAGQARVPLLLWGPYFWADGTTPRKSDNLVWQRADLAGDGTHPSESGRQKVAEMLLKFFTEDSLAKTWFARK
jgi:lysophospholipase L1-like esterase